MCARPRSTRAQSSGEFVTLTGYNRSYATRLLGAASLTAPGPRALSSNRIYDEAVKESLIVLWEAADRICGKRLQATLPSLIESLEGHGHLQLDLDLYEASCSQSARHRSIGCSNQSARSPAAVDGVIPAAATVITPDGPDPDLGRLAWPRARLPGNRPGGPLWRQHGRELHPVADR